MYDFIRLLELAGLKPLLEDMTPAQATAVFKQYGASDIDLKPENIKTTRSRLAKKYHPDVTGGDSQALGVINAAYDVLKNSGGVSGTTHTGREIPPWQTDSRASYNGISREDYTDQNFFKKRMWELSNRSKERWTIYAFDGKFFRSTITVFGNPSIFAEMARAMIIWNSHGGNAYNTRAIFVQDEDDTDVILIWLDGKNIRPPLPMEHGSHNRNPGNDPEFVRDLPKTLNQITSGKD